LAPPSLRARSASGCVALAIAIQLGVGLTLFRSTGRDDAYITFWPAWTLVHHGALENYSGERVEQSSSLLQTLLLAALHALSGIGIPELGWTSGIAAAALAVALAPRLVPPGTPGAGAVAWIAALSAPLLYWSFSGMETPLVALLGVLLALCARSAAEGRGALGRPALGGSVVLAYLLARPEAPLLAIPLFGALALWLAAAGRGDADARAAGGRVARLGAIALGLAAGIALARLAWFGSALPQPVIAKSPGLSAVALARGIDYLAGVPSLFPLYAGLLAALGVLARRRVDRVQACGPAAAALLSAGQLSFAALSGGDWMEAGRLVAPAVPSLAVATVFACQALPSRALRLGALALVLALCALGTLDVARRESTGIPIWTQPQSVFLPRYEGAPLCERANRIHVRDMPAAAALGEILTRLAPPGGQRIQVFTGQGGMLLFDALRPVHGRVGVLDRSGLLDRTLTSSPTAVARGRSRYGLNVEFDTILDLRARIRAESGLPDPDVIFDLHFSANELESLRRAGFERVYVQSGVVEHGDAELPGLPVSAQQSIFVQRRHLERLADLPMRAFEFAAAGAAASGAGGVVTPPPAPGTSPGRGAP
jgi:hypothetical protein